MRIHPGPAEPSSATGLLRAVTLIAAMLAAVLAGVGPAGAHAALAGSTPADGDRIETAPPQVTLTFNESIQPSFATIAVLGPDGRQWARSEPHVAGRHVSVDLDGLGPAGRYTVGFRVVSTDGHPIQGDYTFELTRAHTAASATSTTPDPTTGQPATAATASDSDDSPGFPVWILAIVLVVLVVAGLALALRPGNRRSGR
ncbi:copper resistance CopC family protein [Nocardia amamiensis]|uniref:copper resistance CopC family protein n=1 Tax=Nocardia amamiensis TaxID=404578 RepID=UPI0033E6F2EB